MGRPIGVESVDRVAQRAELLGYLLARLMSNNNFLTLDGEVDRLAGLSRIECGVFLGEGMGHGIRYAGWRAGSTVALNHRPLKGKTPDQSA